MKIVMCKNIMDQTFYIINSIYWYLFSIMCIGMYILIFIENKNIKKFNLNFYKFGKIEIKSTIINSSLLKIEDNFDTIKLLKINDKIYIFYTDIKNVLFKLKGIIKYDNNKTTIVARSPLSITILLWIILIGIPIFDIIDLIRFGADKISLLINLEWLLIIYAIFIISYMFTVNKNRKVILIFLQKLEKNK